MHRVEVFCIVGNMRLTVRFRPIANSIVYEMDRGGNTELIQIICYVITHNPREYRMNFYIFKWVCRKFKRLFLTELKYYFTVFIFECNLLRLYHFKTIFQFLASNFSRFIAGCNSNNFVFTKICSHRHPSCWRVRKILSTNRKT